MRTKRFMDGPTPLRRELLLSFGLLFGEATILMGIALVVILPRLPSSGQITLLILLLSVAQLLVVMVFGGWVLNRRLLAPVSKLVNGIRRIAGGEYHHRIEAPDSLELSEISDSVNLMADRLIADQEVLAHNVSSLEATNRELVEARHQAVQSARLASVGTLAAGIAHEVGNPLGAIMGYVDVVESRLEASQGDTELLTFIREEAQRIDRIVRGLLDYARPAEQGVELLSPGEVVEHVRDFLVSQGQLAGIEHEWRLADTLPRVYMNRHRLEQVLVNLLLNAIQAGGENGPGKIEVTADTKVGPGTFLLARREDDPPGINYLHRRRVARDEHGLEVGALQTAEELVVITVADEGPGIDPENLEYVFDPFFTTKAPGTGTGLGLFISAQLVEGMGGRIDVTNRPGGGAAFAVSFPAIADQEEQSVIENAGQVEGRV
ncbi:MAG: hypothetical protein BMS9Abin29_0599 [Gemmatimonadota bacterium]|nr:MAG: hypothetical protein BMS9Abin29_0599 [Gemmatimonadota bacterium]